MGWTLLDPGSNLKGGTTPGCGSPVIARPLAAHV